MKPRAATQEVIDLAESGIKNPIELSLRTGKSVMAVQSIGYRYDLDLDKLPTSRTRIKTMEREIREKLRLERAGEEPATAPANLGTSSPASSLEDVKKDNRYYLVLAVAYKRVDEHIDKLEKEFPNDKGLDRLRTDLRQASAVAEAKVALATSDVGDLVE